ncbi:hypothetical protein N7462_011089 [Penicillium macrosclerotiorum]|uniref:uncharacterized protein n=1 Tax=Penicillium macrosclerotiorum TaxID=303699 RepID=UPI0025475256|nr:uncharacterized protein N7462_011089 [Penicillium macrosclerotiorum]KAJ5666680.1 hypothetical protein N7462_011089 [Penicillium macrosclerotiorum]
MALSEISSKRFSEPKSFHIFGSGISFSISPTIHNAGFKHYNLPYFYDIRESATINEVAGLIAQEEFGGGSVTMPHKLQVHKYCDDQTETASLIGAINTLIVTRKANERKIIGDNTDWSGLYNIIVDYAARTMQQPNTGLVIGAGGASRAALYAMHRAGLKEIYLVNRTSTVSEKVKEDFKAVFNITVLPSLENLPQKPDIIIGTIPAETTKEEQFHSIFGLRGLCIEMSYKPRQTPLLAVAQKNEMWDTVTGVEVLLAQAYDQFRLWTELDPPKESMINAVVEHEHRMMSANKGGML